MKSEVCERLKSERLENLPSVKLATQSLTISNHVSADPAQSSSSNQTAAPVHRLRPSDDITVQEVPPPSRQAELVPGACNRKPGKQTGSKQGQSGIMGSVVTFSSSCDLLKLQLISDLLKLQLISDLLKLQLIISSCDLLKLQLISDLLKLQLISDLLKLQLIIFSSSCDLLKLQLISDLLKLQLISDSVFLYLGLINETGL
ncbi:hypothetical protein NQZ68_035669 [Dissostichus eleginoides]|nr:hypothetical protein NQZ68_035669 [Dissostichus eleginoides]